jgi:hypothetical protein
MNSVPTRGNIPSIAQLILSLVGFCLSILFALGLMLMQRANDNLNQVTILQSQQMSYLTWVCLVIAAIAIPSLVLSIRRLTGKAVPEKTNQHRFAFACGSLALLGPLAYLGSKASELNVAPWIIALVTVLVVSIPLVWFVEFGVNRLPSGSAQRQWGLINFGVFFTLPLVIMVELVMLIAAFAIGFVWLVQQPEFAPLLVRFQGSAVINPQEIPGLLNELEPLIQKPGVIAAAFLGISLFIPLIEELLKPLALWFFMKRGWSPAEGFTAGLLCGAVFAFVESLTSLGSITGAAWLPTVFGRVGTGLLHVFTSGLIGWALTSAWRDSNYWRLGLVYLASVSIHGIWNFFALLYGISPLLNMKTLPSIIGFSSAAPWILVVIAVWMVTMLYAMNRKLRSDNIPQIIPPIPVETLE